MPTVTSTHIHWATTQSHGHIVEKKEGNIQRSVLGKKFDKSQASLCPEIFADGDYN